jgi:hypothetical protein
MTVAEKVAGLMDSFSKVDAEPQWRRRISGAVKKKAKTVMDYLTKASDEEFSESEEEKEELAPSNKVEGLDVTLLPHQVQGLAWLVSREEGKARGGILADDASLLLEFGGQMLTISIDGTWKDNTVYWPHTYASAPSLSAHRILTERRYSQKSRSLCAHHSNCCQCESYEAMGGRVE